nr:esterase [Quercus suber]
MATIEEQRKQVESFRDAFRKRPNLPVGVTQKAFPQSAPVKGPVWIAQDDVRAATEHGVRDSLFEVITSAAVEPIVLPTPGDTTVCDVHVEWVGHRPGVARDARMPAGLSDADIFSKLQTDAKHDLTILFTHGGAFYLGSSATSRATTTKLARLTKGRVVTVDYRLAPQNQFPSQLLDLLLVYLALLYPPPGSKHMPIPPSKIVLAGESSGGGLSLSLIQYILHLQRMQDSTEPIVRFGGEDVKIRMPAGVAVLSAEADRSLGLPSWKANGEIDFIQEIQPANASTQPPDAVWPSKPPRHDVYCHSSAFLHPISNPCTAPNWRGSPPLWFAYGEERCIDGGKLIASTASRQGVGVQFAEYMGMPHLFGTVLPHFKQSQSCMSEWAAACRAMVDGNQFTSQAKRISSNKEPGDLESQIDLETLPTFTRDQAMIMIRSATNARELYDGTTNPRSSL